MGLPHFVVVLDTGTNLLRGRSCCVPASPSLGTPLRVLGDGATVVEGCQLASINRWQKYHAEVGTHMDPIPQLYPPAGRRRVGYWVSSRSLEVGSSKGVLEKHLLLLH